MLNDKSRRGQRHLPAARKWASLRAGDTVRLPASEARGGWGAGHYDFFPWRIESFDFDAENAIVRSLADSRIARTISRRELEHWSEHAPFGSINAMRHRPPFGFTKPRWQPKRRTRYA